MGQFKQAISTILGSILVVLSKAFKGRKLAKLASACDKRDFEARKMLWNYEGLDSAVPSRFQLASLISTHLDEKSGEIMQINFSASKGQLLQDLVCSALHGGKTNGYFVEVGVGDGIHLSNTHLLENALDWTGLLVEPNRSFHPSIQSNRRARLDIRAAGKSAGTNLLFSENTVTGELSGFTDTISERPDSKGDKHVEYEVEVESLSVILSESDMPNHIDFMSLDTEGGEIDILETVDWSHTSFGFLAIEHNFENGKLQALDALLLPKGYVRILEHHSAFDAWYVESSLANKLLKIY